MKRISSYVLFIIGVIIFSLTSVSAVEAAELKFNPTTSTVSTGNTTQVEVKVNSGTDQIAGTDIYIVYDATTLEYVGTTAGSHFPIVTSTLNNGRVYISAVVDNSSQYKVGEGTVATVTFRALKAGTSTLQYYCDLSQNNTSKIVKNDINATNIIQCAANGTHVVTITGAGGTTGPGTTGNPTYGGNPGGTGGTSGGTYGGGSGQLPQSGIYDTIAKFTIPGIILLATGAAMRLLLKI